jgi:predicted RNA-binding protein with PUA-like domain
MPNYWLIKSEPEAFSIDDLAAKGEAPWDGVRNYQARNFMMNDMKVGDQLVFYHSSSEPPGIAGLAEVSGAAQPDPTQFNKNSKYFDAKASKAKPIWFCVTVKFKKKFKQLLPLADLRADPRLKDMALLRKGQRLSIQPVTAEEFKVIKQLAG